MGKDASDREKKIIDEIVRECDRCAENEIDDGPTEISPNGVIVVKSIEENNSEHDDWLHAYHKLLDPIPLATWPLNRKWSQILKMEFPWMDSIIQKIERQNIMSRRMENDAFKIAPILLVGKPGIGKTQFLRRLGELLAVPTVFLPLSGSSDNLLIKGSSRNFTNTKPGILVDAMNEHQIANPFVILDEIDKVSESQKHGRVWEAILSMIDPSGNQHIMDECLRGEVDYSYMSWLATANNIDNLPAPLRSRFSIVEMDGPEPEDYDRVVYNIKKMIAKSYQRRIELLPDLDKKVDNLLRLRFEKKQFSLRNMYKVMNELFEIEITAEEELGGNALKHQRFH